MKKPNENDILETTLSLAEKGYPEAYRFLLNAYEESPNSFGPQAFYFLACLADGPELALAWLQCGADRSGEHPASVSCAAVPCIERRFGK